MYNPLLFDYPSGYPMCKKRLKYPVGTTNCFPEKCCLMKGRLGRRKMLRPYIKKLRGVAVLAQLVGRAHHRGKRSWRPRFNSDS